jgi:hypothetical protein
MSLPLLLDRAALPLDAARRATLALALRDRRVAHLVVERDARLSVVVGAHATVAFTLAVLVPTVLVVLGPVLLGVAHVAADVRYLVLRRGLPRYWVTAVFAFALALIGVRVAIEARVAVGAIESAELCLVLGWVLLGLASGGREGRSRVRPLAGAAMALGLAWLAALNPRGARLVFAHTHNLVALVLWVALFRKRASAVALPVVAIVGAALLLASGALYSVTMDHGVTRAFGTHVFETADWLAPGMRADRGVGLTAAYAFLQSVHYLVWLVLVPQDDAAGRGLSSFRRSFSAMSRDFGTLGLGLLGVAVVAVLVGAVFGAQRMRNLYLSLALFHGYLELALLAYFWARGRSVRARST